MKGQKMLVQISSGQGPAECEIAVEKLYKELNAEFGDLEILQSHTSRFSNGYTSILFSTENDLSDLEGTIQWICQSPIRPNHKRKNWYMDVSIIKEVPKICKDQEFKFERFHCGGNGGQNVNKVETGVRLTHIPTGITVTSTAQRSQSQNRQDAVKKINAILVAQEISNKSKQTNDAWKEHTHIIRGNPIRVYEGINFKRKK